MKLKYLFVSLTSIVSVWSYAQSGVIAGKIVDESNQFSLPGATIKIENSNRTTISNQNGSYEFLNLPVGTYTVYVDYIGYTSGSKQIVVTQNQTSSADFQLKARFQDIKEVVVLGDYLRGQAKAMNQQKTNANITNIISADQIGRFPDANVGDALKRVSGITMQNDQGEARNIIIRGLAPHLNSVTLNGDRIPSAEGDNRNVQMDLIPSDMISTIQVNKTLTSDMDADAIGGSVNLILRAAPNKERISATLAGGYSPIREHGNYTSGFVYGNRFLNSKLGAVLSASYNNNTFGSDNIEAEWALGDGDQPYVSDFEIRKYDVQRVRSSVALALDYEFNQNNKLFFNAMYNQRNDRENRFAVGYEVDPIYDDNNEIIGYEGNMFRQNKGGIGDNKNKNTRLEIQKVQNYSLAGEHLLGSSVDMDWSVNYAFASEKKPNERYIEFENEDLTLMSDLRNPRKPLISAVGEDLGDYELASLSQSNGLTEESELGAKLNFRFPFSVVADQKGRIRTGARVRIKDKDRNNDYFEYEPVNEFGLTDVPTTYFSGQGFNPGSQYVPGTFATAAYLGGLDLNNPASFESESDPSEFLSENFKAKENIYAAYIRWDQNFTDKFSAIIGARVEHTTIDYNGNFVLDEEELVNQINRKNSYTNILPSLTLRYDVQPDFIIRAAATTALARPNYYGLVPYVNAIPDDQEIFVGNPDLKATYAYNFDLLVEKYFSSIGIISGGVFYKNLKNFIYTYSSNNYSASDFANDYGNETNPIPTGEEWDYIQQRNGDKVDLFGFEVALQRQLDFLPGQFLQGFGVYLNYTYTKSTADGITNEDGEQRSGLGLPGTAPHLFNASLSWENKKFSARVSLNHASDYLDELGGDDFEDRYYDKQTFLDANASYKINKNFRIFAEANNLTNQPLRYYQGVSDRTMQEEYYQPKFNLGVKIDF